MLNALLVSVRLKSSHYERIETGQFIKYWLVVSGLNGLYSLSGQHLPTLSYFTPERWAMTT